MILSIQLVVVFMVMVVLSIIPQISPVFIKLNEANINQYLYICILIHTTGISFM